MTQETQEPIQEETELIDPRNQLIEVKNEEVTESFTIAELEEHIARLNGQIENIKTSSEAEIQSLEEDKIKYREKILSNAYEGYQMPEFSFIDENNQVEE